MAEFFRMSFTAVRLASGAILRLGCSLVLAKRERQKGVNLVVGKREFTTFQSFVGDFVSLGRSAGSEFVRCRDLQSEHIQGSLKIWNVGIGSVAMGDQKKELFTNPEKFLCGNAVLGFLSGWIETQSAKKVWSRFRKRIVGSERLILVSA